MGASPVPATAADRLRLLDRYRAGHDAVVAALAGADPAALDHRPAPGEWTARQVVHHLADSELTSAIRLRLLLAEDEPLIPAYDERRFAERLRYDRPIEVSLAAVRAARAACLDLLELLTDADWARGGRHETDGAYGVGIWLRNYADHPHDHAAQIRAALSAVPLPTG